jgi:hypothetical protein
VAGTRKSRWRAEVYRTGAISNTTRVLLLLLSDHMDNRGYVSVPRSELARLLGVSRQRITERFTLAVEVGMLDVVRRGRPGVTAVYQATIPRSAHGPDGGTNANPLHGPDSRSLHGPDGGTKLKRLHGTPGGVAKRYSVAEPDGPPEVRTDDGVSQQGNSDTLQAAS